LVKMLETWLSTVRRETSNSAAIVRLDSPRITRSATARLASVSASQPVAGLLAARATDAIGPQPVLDAARVVAGLEVGVDAIDAGERGSCTWYVALLGQPYRRLLECECELQFHAQTVRGAQRRLPAELGHRLPAHDRPAQ